MHDVAVEEKSELGIATIRALFHHERCTDRTINVREIYTIDELRSFEDRSTIVSRINRGELVPGFFVASLCRCPGVFLCWKDHESQGLVAVTTGAEHLLEFGEEFTARQMIPSSRPTTLAPEFSGSPITPVRNVFAHAPEGSNDST